MAPFLQKIAIRSWRNCTVEEISATFERRKLTREYGNRAKFHVRTVGLLSCFQIQHATVTSHSVTDRPERAGQQRTRSAVSHTAAAPSIIRIHTPSLKSEHSSSSGAFQKHVCFSTNFASIFFRTSKREKISNDLHNLSPQNECHFEINGSGMGSLNLPLDRFKVGLSTICQHRPLNLDFHEVQRTRFSTQLLDLLKQKGGAKSGVQIRHYAARSRRPASRKKEKSYYEVLGITPHATQAQVKEAYFKLSKVYHPDKNAGCKDAHSRFAAINEAYSVLGNHTLRRRYDRGLLSQRDIHGEVKEEEKQPHEYPSGSPVYTGTGIPFSEEAQRQAKNMDDFFSKHYKDALDKERRERVERKQRMDEYMELQQKAKVSPFVLALFMLMAVTFAVKSVSSSAAVDRKLRNGNSCCKQKASR